MCAPRRSQRPSAFREAIIRHLGIADGVSSALDMPSAMPRCLIIASRLCTTTKQRPSAFSRPCGTATERERPAGCAFVKFLDRQEAVTAIENLNEKYQMEGDHAPRHCVWGLSHHFRFIDGCAASTHAQIWMHCASWSRWSSSMITLKEMLEVVAMDAVYAMPPVAAQQVVCWQG